MDHNGLLIFVKNPVEGKVKTRLAKTIGDQNALLIYHALLNHTRTIASEISVSRYLFYDEKIEINDDWFNDLYTKNQQVNGDLGKRMSAAFEHVFSKGVSKAIIIGSDCIELTTEIITNAFELLENNDVVIGPALDGGYYLLGMKTLHNCIFENKSWSTDLLIAETLESLKKENLSVQLMPKLSDIDTETDLTPELRNLIVG